MEWDEKDIDQEHVRLFVMQDETCETTDRRHWQGFIVFTKCVRMSQAKTIMGTETVHLKPADGTDKENYDYCTKEGKGGRTQGGRVVVGGPWDKILNGPKKKVFAEATEILQKRGVRALYDENPEFCLRHGKQIKTFTENFVFAYADDADTKDRKVLGLYIWGSPGVGKSYTVMNSFKRSEIYRLGIVRGGTNWFDNYQGQKVLFIDDLDKHAIDETQLQIWYDGYPTQVQTKGGHVWANWEVIVICSNWSFAECFVDLHGAVARRFAPYRMAGRDAAFVIQKVPRDKDHVLDKDGPCWKKIMEDNAALDAAYGMQKMTGQSTQLDEDDSDGGVFIVGYPGGNPKNGTPPMPRQMANI